MSRFPSQFIHLRTISTSDVHCQFIMHSDCYVLCFCFALSLSSSRWVLWKHLHWHSWGHSAIRVWPIKPWSEHQLLSPNPKRQCEASTVWRVGAPVWCSGVVFLSPSWTVFLTRGFAVVLLPLLLWEGCFGLSFKLFHKYLVNFKRILLLSCFLARFIF